MGCACSQWGRPCAGDVCGCTGLCDNAFNQISYLVDQLYGSDVDRSRLRLRPCFVNWAFQKKVALRNQEITVDSLFDEVYPRLVEYDEELVKYFADWNESWLVVVGNRLNSNLEAQAKRGQLKRELVRYAITKEGRWWFSFCGEGTNWVHQDSTWHCESCKKCMSCQEWHCALCDKCTYGMSVPCHWCDGVSASYHDIHRKEHEREDSKKASSV